MYESALTLGKLELELKSENIQRFYLFGIMLLVVFAVEILTLHILYEAAFEEKQLYLTNMVRNQARTIEAVARFDIKQSSDFPGGNLEATLSQLREARTNFEGFGETGEFLLAKLENEEMLFLLQRRQIWHSPSSTISIPFNSVLAEPMRRALKGESGTVVAKDYKGEMVLAAYEPIGVLNLGLVAKIDLSEIRTQFFKAGFSASIGGLIITLAGALVFLRLSEHLVRSIRENQEMITFISHAQGKFIEDADPKTAFSELLENILSLTQSQHGFIAELLNTPEGEPYIRGYDFRTIVHKDEFEHFIEKSAPPNFEFYNLDNLLGEVIRTGKPVISNDPSQDPRRGKIGPPPGHPELNCYLGMPLYHGSKLMGMIGIANRPGGYDENLAKFLEPFLATSGNIIQAYNVDLELKRSHEQLEERVKERTTELEIAKNEAESADRLKSLFLASMSHELRTPLNSIIGFTGITLEGQVGEINPKQKDYLGRAYQSSKHLLGLISDIMDISKIESGTIEASRELFNLNEVVTEACDCAYTQKAKDKGLEFKVELPSALEVYNDRKRVLQCIVNLLSNAVKFTPSGVITLSAREADNKIVIVVEDTGIGIAKDDLPKLFRQFERLDSPLKVKAGGTGLGLYLTKKLATEVLGGSVDAESRLGVGSKFFLKLPKILK